MRRKLEIFDFIDRANNKHNNQYTYDRVVLVNTKIKVSITCSEHGDFPQTPSNHLSGQGCPKCANNQKSSKEEFIVKADLIHNKIYNYDEVVYVNCDTEVKIECKIHGFFDQTPYNHLRTNGCSKCLGKNKTISMFIDQANLAHNFAYSYSKLVYIKSKIEVTITCPIHGDFLQLPNNHLQGHGCRECGKEKRKKLKITNQEFIIKANQVHNFKYNYDKLNYINSQKIEVTITCPIHGDFPQLPHNHLRGHGCSKCKLSKGEKQIFKILKNLNVEFKTQYKFDDCIYKKKLLFDFAIFINDKVKLIEFQGEQHFKEIPYFQSLDNRNSFNEIKIRDKIKQKYAKDNKINFLTINFNQIDKMEELITDFIESEF